MLVPIPQHAGMVALPGPSGASEATPSSSAMASAHPAPAVAGATAGSVSFVPASLLWIAVGLVVVAGAVWIAKRSSPTFEEYLRRVFRHVYIVVVGVIGGTLGLASLTLAAPNGEPLVPTVLWAGLLFGGLVVAHIWRFAMYVENETIQGLTWMPDSTRLAIDFG